MADGGIEPAPLSVSRERPELNDIGQTAPECESVLPSQNQISTLILMELCFLLYIAY